MNTFFNTSGSNEVTYNSGFRCVFCHGWVPWGTTHTCVGYTPPVYTTDQAMSDTLLRIERLLEAIHDRLNERTTDG